MISSAKKRVSFGKLRVREFERAPLGEHPLAKGGFALQLGPRYRDWAPMEIPNGPLQQRYDFYINVERRKQLWIDLWLLEQELLNGRPILGGGQKELMDEQRWFERQGQAKKPLLEQTMDEQRWFEYQTPLERRLEQQPPRKFASERMWNRRRGRWIRQWRADQAIIDRQWQHCRKVAAARNEQKRLRREMREKMEQEIRENERRRMLSQPREEIELERSRQELHDNSPVEVVPAVTASLLSSDATWDVFLLIALELAFISVLMLGFLIVPFLLDTLFDLSICKYWFATLSRNGFTRQYRQTLSFCMEYCSAADCCIFVLVCSCVLFYYSYS
jgi:hypothetical protein